MSSGFGGLTTSSTHNRPITSGGSLARRFGVIIMVDTPHVVKVQVWDPELNEYVLVDVRITFEQYKKATEGMLDRLSIDKRGSDG